MTPEQRIAHLEADLARERAEKDDLRAMLKVLVAKVESETAQKAARRERNARHRAKDVSVDVSRDVSNASLETSHAPSPSSPLPSPFPPSPAPSSPHPLSFPPSSPPPEKPREPRQTAAPSVDLHSALSAVHAKHEGGREMPWSMGLETVHRRLLALAAKSGCKGAELVAEVARRYDHMRQRAGMQYEPARWKGTTLEELAREVCWGGNAKPPERPVAKSQAPTMSQHNWDTLPPVHVAASDASEPY